MRYIKKLSQRLKHVKKNTKLPNLKNQMFILQRLICSAKSILSFQIKCTYQRSIALLMERGIIQEILQQEKIFQRQCRYLYYHKTNTITIEETQISHGMLQNSIHTTLGSNLISLTQFKYQVFPKLTKYKSTFQMSDFSSILQAKI